MSWMSTTSSSKTIETEPAEPILLLFPGELAPQAPFQLFLSWTLLTLETTNNHHWPRGKLGNLTGPYRPGRPRCPNVFSLRCTTPALPKRRYRVLSTATPAWVGYGSPMDLHRSMSGCLPDFVTFIACPNPGYTHFAKMFSSFTIWRFPEMGVSLNHSF